MQKRIPLLGLVVCVVTLFGALISGCTAGERPFEDLTAEGIADVSIVELPSNQRTTADSGEIRGLVEILHKVVTYKEDNSHQEMGGQVRIITIVKEDGTETTVGVFGPYLIIDGIGYKVKNEASELNAWASRLLYRSGGSFKI